MQTDMQNGSNVDIFREINAGSGDIDAQGQTLSQAQIETDGWTETGRRMQLCEEPRAVKKASETNTGSCF